MINKKVLKNSIKSARIILKEDNINIYYIVNENGVNKKRL